MKFDWSEQTLKETVKNCICWWDWMRILGVPTRGCNYRTLKKKAAEYKIDTSHFNYKYARTHNGKRIVKNRSNSEIFNDTTPIKVESVKSAYIERILNGIPHCERCGITNWNNEKIVFQLHHKDGDYRNNKLENIILLCPNCHSQTENFRNNKNNK